MTTLQMANKTNRIYNDIMCRLFKYMVNRTDSSTSFHESLTMYRFITDKLNQCSTILTTYFQNAEE